ncbi:cell division protein FtsQ/DivIB [Luteolibacter marinus]|uniref:cell division protein FtsQ/DivIB n=1 Tax=Luteolibacter marinus TaxID=2776705 RepID=UPI0018685D76|nr:FtsQ-type POTRA domain-containing protein [Luteolibacter marinus]
MLKRRTSKVQHRRQVKVLQANVVSPRIIWFGILKSCRKLVRFALVLGLIGAAVWGARYGIRHGLMENEKFRLQTIQLSPNPILDERAFAKLSGINLKGSLFDCDAADIEARLYALPEIAGASVRREFPGTLVVDVVPRKPRVWISSASHGIAPRDPGSGLLVDRLGYLFHCPAAMFEEASKLPVVELGEGGEVPVAGARIDHPEYERLMRLYKVACNEIESAPEWIDTLVQSRSWSLDLRSRDGTLATFGLGDHERQMKDLKAVLEDAREEGEVIESIELIPEKNIPVALRGESAPRAILIDEPEPVTAPDRRARDLQNLLNR